MQSRKAILAAILIGCSAIVPRAAYCEVVYDSLPSVFGGGILAVEVGQSMALAGSARTITQIDLRFSSINDIEKFRVRFYTVDANNLPGSLLWTSPLQNWTDPTPGFATKVVSVAVPNILVPDHFAWTAAPEFPTQLIQVTSDAATIGTPLSGFQLDPPSPDGWFPLTTTIFGARVVAIPEPTTFLLALAGAELLPLRRRRR
jgi:hypothetical protein